VDEAKFRETAERYRDMTIAIDTGVAPGQREFYNAYWKGTEVVVLGYTFQGDDGHKYTKPLAVIVDDEVFRNLRVDHETGRFEGDDGLQPPKVV
jgi:hypothetical protein